MKEERLILYDQVREKKGSSLSRTFFAAELWAIITYK